MEKLENFIGGELCVPHRRQYLPGINPSTSEVYLQIPDSDAYDLERAVGAAHLAFASWSKTSATERARILYRVADLIDSRAQELAVAEARDQGKPVWLASSLDIPRAAHNFRFFAGAILHHLDATSEMDAKTFNYVSRRPVGVAGLISPWNLPLYLLTWKIAPALAAGNTVVCKPSELTSHTAFLLCEILREGGVPAGVVNVVFGSGPGVGAALVTHPQVPVISFTGGTATGRKISEAAAPQFKKLSLELGGKNPVLIFDDADLDEAVAVSVKSSFLNQGEICLCGSRIYVHSAVFDEFLSRLSDKVRSLVVGDPFSSESQLGPLVSADHLQKVLNYLDLAKKEGTKTVCGGERPQLPAPLDKGYFLQPTVLTEVPRTSRLQSEEIFGPVVTVTRFESDEEALELANESSYGLAAVIWTQSLSRAHGLAARLDAGTVWINTWMKRDLRMPFGGVKSSGVGREGQSHSLEFFTESKTVCVQHS